MRILQDYENSNDEGSVHLRKNRNEMRNKLDRTRKAFTLANLSSSTKGCAPGPKKGWIFRTKEGKKGKLTTLLQMWLTISS